MGKMVMVKIDLVQTLMKRERSQCNGRYEHESNNYKIYSLNW